MQKLNMENPFSKGAGEKAEIYYKELTDSTMNDARRLIGEKVPTGTAVLASEQTAGRGRVEGRKWISAKDESLMFTMLVKTSDIGFNLTLFPLFAGFAIAGFLEKEYGIKAKIKWPNDVLIDGRKISGILCENSSGYILCGIGLNCSQRHAGEIAGNRAVSICELNGEAPDIRLTLSGLLGFMKDNWNSTVWKDKVEEKLYMKGLNVLLCDGLPDSGKRIEGIIEGIGGDGELIITEKHSGLLRKVYSGEILCK